MSSLITFAGQSSAYVIDLAAGTYAEAARIMAIGDSLTEGFVNFDDPTEDPALREGYRLDLFERILADDGWIDYVGSRQHGPTTMLDRDHEAVGGKRLSAIVDDSTGPSDFSSALTTYLPHVVLFKAGTNDFQNNGDEAFRNIEFPNILANTIKAIDQFYAYAGTDDKYLVVSTLAPKTRSNVPEEYADLINEGYSMLNGSMVPGDIGNGTYVPGLIATLTAQQALHPTLLIYTNPVDEVADLTLDHVHYSDFSYERYADGLFDLLASEIGLTDGTYLANTVATGGATDTTGGDAGDRIGGDAGTNNISGGAGSDFIEGRAGADNLQGGTDADVFAYGLDALDGLTDQILDYSAAEGDVISIGAIVDHFGWSPAETAANVAITDTAAGAEIAVTTPSGTFVIAVVQGVAASDITLVTTQFTQSFEAPTVRIGTEGGNGIYDDEASLSLFGLGGNDRLFGGAGNDNLYGGTGRDSLYGGTGADIFHIRGADIDGQRDDIFDFSVAEGDKLDISEIGTFFGWTEAELESRLDIRNSNSNLQLRLDQGSGFQTFALIRNMDRQTFENANSLITDGGPPPDTGDDDGNLTLTIPDIFIDATENTAVVVSVSGLDADATGVVTLSIGGTDLTQNISADGDVIFDLSGQPDGQVATSVTATDTNGNTTTVAGPDITLATAPDTSADVDGNLAVSAPDSDIDSAEVSSVAFDVTGLDADATAIVSVTDGVSTVTSTALASDGTVNLDLSGLSDGSLTATVTATDGAGNTATADTTLTLDTVTPPTTGTLLGTVDADVLVDGNGSTMIFGFDRRDVIQAGGGDDYLFGGVGKDTLFGGDGADKFVYTSDDIGFERDFIEDFSITDGDQVDVSQVADFYGWTAQEIFDRLTFRKAGSGLELKIDLPTGTVAFAFIKNMTPANFLAADTLVLESGPPPDTGDDDGNLALVAPDTFIDATENDAVVVSVSGIDADATAVVSLVINGTTLTQPISADGDVVFDLTSVADGVATTSVTATDANGNESSVDGPSITLSTAPDTSADVDGNLAVTAPDTEIDLSEVGSVDLTVSGLDPDATAIVTVTDGTTSVTSASIAVDGTVTLDLTSLDDGTLDVTVTATDGAANVATAVTTISLDTVTPPVTGTLIGTENGDLLIDGDGASEIYGLGRRDTIQANGGDDIIVGGVGKDTLFGGEGEDTFVYRADDIGFERDVIEDFSIAEGDKIDISDVSTFYGWTAQEAFDNLTFRKAGNGLELKIDLPGGTKAFTYIKNIKQADFLAADTLILDGTGAGSTPPPPEAPEGSGEGEGSSGSSGSEETVGITMSGTAGNDVIVGSSADDILRGKGGDDQIEGGAGSDIIKGDEGADTFIFTVDALDGSQDRIDGFKPLEGDVIDLVAVASTFGWLEADAQSYLSFVESSKGVTVDIVSPDINVSLAFFGGLTLADLSVDDFVFV